MTILFVVLILVFLIVVHELGHFIAAKIFGVKVEEFGIGYPPRALLLGTVAGTEYTINWIPFGGFVRLFGEEVDSGQRGRGSFADSPRWKQAVVLVAGVLMNAIAAWVLFIWALTAGVPTVVDQLQPNEHAELVASDVIEGSPAAAVGIAAGDQILSLSDQSGDVPDAMTPDAFVAFVSSRGGELLTLSFMHDNATTTKTVIPAHAVNADTAGRPAIGIGLVLITNEALPFSQALAASFTATENSFIIVWQGLWEILKTAAHGAPDLTNVVGPVGLVSVVGQAAQNGFGQVLELAGFISINLVIVNLLPIPALDGGKLFVLIIEAVLRRKAPKLAIQLLNTIGVALIILLMVTVTYHDIARLFV